MTEQLNLAFLDKEEAKKLSRKECRNCRHFKKWPPQFNSESWPMGYCKLHCPIHGYTKKGQFTTRYPSVAETDFCNEFISIAIEQGNVNEPKH